MIKNHDGVNGRTFQLQIPRAPGCIPQRIISDVCCPTARISDYHHATWIESRPLCSPSERKSSHGLMTMIWEVCFLDERLQMRPSWQPTTKLLLRWCRWEGKPYTLPPTAPSELIDVCHHQRAPPRNIPAPLISSTPTWTPSYQALLPAAHEHSRRRFTREENEEEEQTYTGMRHGGLAALASPPPTTRQTSGGNE